jgi:NAD+ synthase (glutamine-hydrolysing)
MKKIKVGAAALNQTPLDWSGNLSNIKKAIEKAKEDAVDILCLPELCITGYGCEDLFLSDWLPEKAYSQLTKVVELTEGIALNLTIPLKVGSSLYNASCFIKNKQIIGFTPKQNLANEGIHYEPRWFKPGVPEQSDIIKIGDQSFPFGVNVFEISGVKIGFETCEDAWSGDKRPLCQLKSRGVDLILNSSASHFAIGKPRYRKELVRQASENFNCAYVMVNLLGNESGRIIFDGQTIFSHNGVNLQSSEILSFEDFWYSSQEFVFDPGHKVVIGESPEYSSNEEFTAAVSLALFDYLRKSKSQGFVLSLSGGADSSSCAILVAEMIRRGIDELGVDHFIAKTGIKSLEMLTEKDKTKENIARQLLTCAYQGTSNSSEETFRSAKVLAESIGATFYHWSIDNDVSSYTQKIEKSIGRPLSWDKDDITLQNIQSRARAPIIWMLANIQNSLLITTSNRSEGDVGYATMDGDTSGSLAPIAAIDKYFILKWLQWAEKELGYVGLNAVNRLNPTAELRPPEHKQSDEDDLMPYHILTEIEKLAVGKRLSPQEIFQVLRMQKLDTDEKLKSHITKFFKLWSRNQWKRERIAPSFHLDDFNVDPRSWFRFPILSGGYEEELDELHSIE